MAMPCAGAIHAGKRSAAGASEDALARVQPLLRAISESSGAAVPCLARACVQLKAKSRLQAAKIAAGLQDVIAAHGGQLSYLIQCSSKEKDREGLRSVTCLCCRCQIRYIACLEQLPMWNYSFSLARHARRGVVLARLLLMFVRAQGTTLRGRLKSVEPGWCWRRWQLWMPALPPGSSFRCLTLL